MSQPPVQKKVKITTGPGGVVQGQKEAAAAIQAEVFAGREELRRQYTKNGPYPHLRIPALVDDALLRRVRKEVLRVSFTEKETDIYKVNQTGDLANLDGLEGNERRQLAAVMELRNALYSPAFRELVQDITGCGPLSGKEIDLSINCYSQGSHLLNHDDVIGTRRVSFILYMPDPDVPWRGEDFGGRLELYPVKEKGTPMNEPTVFLEPSWNSFTMFTVLPGHSFHSVEEVIAPIGMKRISISGWFHLPLEGEVGFNPEGGKEQGRILGEEKSTLQQLLEGEFSGFKEVVPDEGEEATVLEGEEEEDEEVVGLDEDEIVFLAEYVNVSYLTTQTTKQLQTMFQDSSYLLLDKVLNSKTLARIVTVTKEEDEKLSGGKGKITKHGEGVGGGWKCHGPPHLYRYLKVDVDEDVGEGSISGSAQLMRELSNLFVSPAFRKWLQLLTILAISSYRACGRRFRPGLDYSLALSNPKALLHVNLCLSPSSSAALTKNKKEVEDWETGKVGGYSSYMTSHQDEGDAAVYNAKGGDEDDVLLTLPCSFNQMVIVLRDEGVLQFIKYVGAGAGGSRWDVDGEYLFREEKE